MKKSKFLILTGITCLAFFLNINKTSAQHPKLIDTVILVKNFPFIFLFDRNGQPLIIEELMFSCKHLEPIPDVYKQLKKARNYDHLHIFFGSPGLLFSGFGLIGLISGEAPNADLLILGSSMLVVSSLFLVAFKNPALIKGVDLYNKAMYQRRANQLLNKEP